MKLASNLFVVLIVGVCFFSCMVESMEPDEYPAQYPLHFYVSQGQEKEVIEFMRDHDINGRDDAGRTPLHSAVRAQHEKMVDLLLAYNATLDVVDKDGAGATPLGYALSRGNEKIIKKLLKANASPTVANAVGWSALHMAAVSGTSTNLVRKLCEQRGADPRAPAFARTYSADQWAKIITERWISRQDYYQELVELAAQKERGLFFEAVQHIKNPEGRHNVQSALETKLEQLEKQKSIDELRCNLALYHVLLNFRCSLRTGGKKVVRTAQEWSTMVSRALEEKTSYFKEQPSLDWHWLNQWADQLVKLTQKPEQLPKVPDLDWQALRKWLLENRKNFIKGQLTGTAAIAWQELETYISRMQKYLEKMQRWDLAVAARKINDHLAHQWCGYLIDVIIGQQLGEFFQMPDKGWSKKELKDWTLHVKRVARLSPTGEYLIVPFFDFESPHLLDAVNFLRKLVQNKLVDAVLVLPPERDTPISAWVDKIARDFISSSSSEESNSSDIIEEIELPVISARDTAQLSDEKWVQHLKKRGPETLQKGLLLGDVIDKEKIGRALQVVKERCASYDCNIFITDEIFSGSLVNESTRARIKEISPRLKVEEILETDDFGRPLKTDHLLVTGDSHDMSTWFHYVEGCVEKSKEHVAFLQKSFADYQQEQQVKIPVFELLKNGIRIYRPPTFASMLISALLELREDLDPTVTELKADDWASRMVAAFNKRLSIDIRPLLYYLLVQAGLTMKVKGGKIRTLPGWISLLEKLPEDKLPEKVKLCLRHQAQLSTYETRDGYMPHQVSMATMLHYVNQLNREHMPLLVRQHDEVLNEGELEELEVVRLATLKFLAQEHAEALWDSIAAMLDAQELGNTWQALKAYFFGDLHGRDKLRRMQEVIQQHLLHTKIEDGMGVLEKNVPQEEATSISSFFVQCLKGVDKTQRDVTWRKIQEFLVSECPLKACKMVQRYLAGKREGFDTRLWQLLEPYTHHETSQDYLHAQIEACNRAYKQKLRERLIVRYKKQLYMVHKGKWYRYERLLHARGQKKGIVVDEGKPLRREQIEVGIEPQEFDAELETDVITMLKKYADTAVGALYHLEKKDIKEATKYVKAHDPTADFQVLKRYKPESARVLGRLEKCGLGGITREYQRQGATDFLNALSAFTLSDEQLKEVPKLRRGSSWNSLKSSTESDSPKQVRKKISIPERPIHQAPIGERGHLHRGQSWYSGRKTNVEESERISPKSLRKKNKSKPKERKKVEGDE